MVSNDMSDDDSVLDPEETPAESHDEGATSPKASEHDEDDELRYGSDAQEPEGEEAEEYDVPEVDDDGGGEAALLAASEEREAEKQAAAKTAEREAPKRFKASTSVPSVLSHFTKQNGSGKEASSARKPEPIKPVQATKPLGASRPRGGKAAASAAAKKPLCEAASATTAPKQKAVAAPVAFSFNNDSEDDEAPLSISMAKNAGCGTSIATVDAVQEYEDKLTAEAAKTPEGEGKNAQVDEPPRVHEAAKKRRYVMKNEKTKNQKWSEYLVSGLLFAQECEEIFQLGMGEITTSSVKDRVAMQSKLADEEMSKMLATLVIGEIKVDGAGSGSGPGITNLMGAIVNELPLSEEEREDLLSKMTNCDPETEVVQLVALDHSIVKRLFKVSNHSALPAIYNPNTNSSNKYRVPAAKLEEQKDTDDHFSYIGLIDANKKPRGGSKRSSEEANNGANGKVDGKRPAVQDPRSREAEMPADGRENLVGIRGSGISARPGIRARETQVHTLADSGTGVHKIESVPLADGSKTHCWIAGDRLYWVEHA